MRRQTFRAALVVALGCGVAVADEASTTAPLDADGLRRSLEAAAGDGRVRLHELARSRDGREIWHVEIGAGKQDDLATRPAMLVVAGVEGWDLAGTATAVAWIETLVAAADDATRELLEMTTIHVVPRLNPDAAATYFANPRLETDRNGRPFDDDHDGLVDEDGPEDLDGDGRILWMRVEDPEGDHVIDPKEPRLMLKADPARGEVGAWRYLREGRDDDDDERWNEDGVGGVNFDRNFPFGYEWFGDGSGLHQVSEDETRALADLIIAHPNIGLVLTFGDADNLSGSPKVKKDGKKPNEEPSGERRRRPKPPTAMHADDVPFLAHLGERYREAVGIDEAQKLVRRPGSFSDWLYYHRGRMSLAARIWSPSLAVLVGDAATDAEPSDADDGEGADAPDAPATQPTASGDEVDGDDAAKTGDTEDEKNEKGSANKKDERNVAERKYLNWLDDNEVPSFVEWQPFDHPDFPGQTVEIGGFVPFAAVLPPPEVLDRLAQAHAAFLTELAGMLPRIEVRALTARHLGRSLHEIELELANGGYLPTALAHGVTTQEVHPTRVILDVDDGDVLAGARRTTLEPIAGSGGVQKARWVVKADGRDRIDVEIVSALGGRIETSVSLGGGR